MTSSTKIAALRIARSLKPAETAMNEATLKILAIGTAVLTPRADGTVHPLEGQAAVARIGSATAKAFEVLADIGLAHRELRALGEYHGMIGEGDIFESPPADTPRGTIHIVPAVEAA